MMHFEPNFSNDVDGSFLSDCYVKNTFLCFGGCSSPKRRSSLPASRWSSTNEDAAKQLFPKYVRSKDSIGRASTETGSSTSFSMDGEKERALSSLYDLNLTQDSSLHTSGKCKPCLFFHKEAGCERGSECSYCHLCGSGSLGKRKTRDEGLGGKENLGAKTNKGRDTDRVVDIKERFVWMKTIQKRVEKL